MTRLRAIPGRYRRPVLATGIVSLIATALFLLLPLAGTDLSAQVARGHFVEAYGLDPVDFRWYGGVFPFGYSMLTGPLNALLGARGVGAVSSVVGALAFVLLLVRTNVPRPMLGGVLGAITLVFNLVSGRTTFAMGTAFGLLALLALTLDDSRPRRRIALVAVLAVVSTVASPVSGLFLVLAGVALIGIRRVRDGVTLCLGSGLPMLVPAFVFPGAGVQPFDQTTAKLVIASSIAVALLVPWRFRVVKIGAVLSAVGLLLASTVPNPVGFNMARLVLLFGIPLVAATVTFSLTRLAVVVTLMTWWAPPLVTGDLARAGSPADHLSFYQPLIDQLDQRQPIGRVEVVPLHDHWESTYVADAVPIARGWERQVDVAQNPLFYDDTLTSPSYQAWLQDNGVSYVALPLRSRLDHWGVQESALIEANLSYLQPVWSSKNWTLYRVLQAQPMVTAPAHLVSSDATGLTFTVRPEDLDKNAKDIVLVRVRWSRWLTLSGRGSCLYGGGDWTLVQVSEPGTFRVSSGWHLRQQHHC